MYKLMLWTFLVPAVSFGAGEYIWVGNASSPWTDPASYTLGGETPEEPPPAGATVIFPQNARAAVDDDSVAFVSSLGRLQVASGVEISVSLTVSNAVLGCAVAGTSTSAAYGTLVKTGSCALTLSAAGKVCSKAKYYDYFTAFDVREGTLAFPQGATALSGNCEYTGTLAVSNNATIVLPDNASTYAQAIQGDGTIDGTGSRTLRVVGSGRSDFSGKLTRLAFDAYYGTVNLAGSASDFTGSVSVNGAGAVLGVGTFGLATDAASSIGTDSPVYVKTSGGRIRCLGAAEETTDKEFSFLYADDAVANLANTGFDAGAFGGVTFAGNWTLYDNKSNPARMRWLVLTGSNTEHACTMSGDMPVENGYDDNEPYTFTVTKRGTGVWRFAGSRALAGAISVDNGVLRFDSLDETGVASALGTATMLYGEYSGKKDASRQVSYALRLGDAEAGTEGVLEYDGAGFAGAKDRAIALKGDGRLRHSGTNGFIRLSGGVSALTAGAKVLTLDGEAVDGKSADCELANVADAADRPISIVKEGSGFWALTGNLDVRGTIRVKAGTLCLRNPVHYTWFRWTLKEPVTAAGGNYRVCEFGLFDANSNRVNLAMSVPGVYHSAVRGNLQYGEAAFTNGAVKSHSSGPLANMFDGSGSTVWRSNYSGVTFDRNNADTWIPIVLHVSAAAPVASFDFAPYYSGTQSGVSPKVFSLEGSVDGATWHELFSEDSVSNVSNAKWYYQNDSPSAAKHGGQAVDTSVPAVERSTAFLQQVESVRVDRGATLKLEGDVTLKDLVVDATGSGSGTGTVTGGALAPAGTIDALVDPQAAKTELPISFESVEGAENVRDWTLKVNGAVTDAYRLKLSQGRLTVVKAQGLILFLQ